MTQIQSSTGCLTNLAPCDHMFSFWVLDNCPAFTAIYSIPCLHGHDLRCFLQENQYLLPVSGKKNMSIADSGLA